MPGTDALHGALTGDNIHVPHAWSYADEAARVAASGFATGDVGKLGLQEDDNSLWLLTDDDPVAWVRVSDSPTEAVTHSIAVYLHGELGVETRALAIIAPMALTVLEVRSAVGTAPDGADLILDVNKNGTTLFTTQANRPTIADGETSDTSAAPDVTAVAQGDVLSLDIDQVGSATPGEALSVTIVCEAAG